MTAALSSLPITLQPPRAELARLCRGIWIDHERAPHGSLETDFAGALAAVQAKHGEEVGEEDLWETVRAEYERVAQATVVAELLLPRLTALLRQRPATATPSIPIANNVVEAPVPARQPVSGIADLIEGMLDQQRNELRNSSSSHRS